jgi:hypothetical protein
VPVDAAGTPNSPFQERDLLNEKNISNLLGVFCKKRLRREFHLSFNFYFIYFIINIKKLIIKFILSENFSNGEG